MISAIELLIGLAALAAAVSVRPWRLLQLESPYELWAPLILLGIALPWMWWWSADTAAPITHLLGSQFALLTLGWPLAVLLFGCAGLAGVFAFDASIADAVGAFIWAGVVPATLGLLAGHTIRVWGRNPFGYLMGRALIVALFSSFTAALLAQSLLGRYDSLGTAVTPALFLTALLDAMLTSACMTLLIARYPRCVATWSDNLYFNESRRDHVAANRKD